VEDDPLAAIEDPPRLRERRAVLPVGVERRQRLEQLAVTAALPASPWRPDPAW